MLSLVLLMPAIVVEVGCVEDSANRVAANMGSIMSWPEWMAVKTERRESQLREGARSRRTVGSLPQSEIGCELKIWNGHTNLPSRGA